MNLHSEPLRPGAIPGAGDDGSFSFDDLEQMSRMGLDSERAARQLAMFREPPPFTRALRPCTIGDGIRALAAEEHEELLAGFDAAARRGLVGKLVPASGAASRMFQELLVFLAEEDAPPPARVRWFFVELQRFAFQGDLAAALAADGHDLAELLCEGGGRTILTYLLTDKGLGYADLPKGLLAFHRYEDGPRTPVEEHLVEAAALARDEGGVCRLHFTVSPNHRRAFEDLLDRVRPGLEARHGCRFEVSFSTQKPATDTLAVDLEDRPFRQEDGTLLFRPGGHGALIENLHALGRAGGDLVLIKNIDNVVPDDRKPEIHRWKRLLGGTLLALRERIFDCLEQVEESTGAADAVIEEAAAFLERDLCRPLPADFASRKQGERRMFLLQALDRPIRVCGVVRNQGEPGGGPFWVDSPAFGVSLQIVESAQLDLGDPDQNEILHRSTHFNPVDLVCGLRDRRGRTYDLPQYVDPTTVFIAEKTCDGRALKALELPGLWNGAMAGWTTVFVEVPAATFAPVKNVLDLLRPEHQAG
jgi:hypothetical protein